ncbi:MAG: hypothetical protein C5B60_05840 [Chloroflexi bacterium]|nr:MAG: hypothetical protein C5B60_05840 [Chloroflexota bacterium]
MLGTRQEDITAQQVQAALGLTPPEQRPRIIGAPTPEERERFINTPIISPEEQQRRQAVAQAAAERRHGYEQTLPSPQLFPGMASVAAPAVRRPEKAWNEFSYDDIPEQQARDLFEQHIGDDPTAFMDEYVGPWRRPGRSKLTWHMSGGNPTFAVEPELWHPKSREWMGSYRRAFKPHLNQVYHDMLSLGEKFQGRRTETHSGIGNAIFDRNIDRMLKGTATPFTKIHALAALDNGGYNWPGRGMLPDKWSWSNLRMHSIPSRIEHLKDNSDILPKHIRQVEDILKRNEDDPRGIWALRGLSDPINGAEIRPHGNKTRRTMSLAKHLLRHQGYNVDLDLNNPEQMEVFHRSRKPEPPYG